MSKFASSLSAALIALSLAGLALAQPPVIPEREAREAMQSVGLNRPIEDAFTFADLRYEDGAMVFTDVVLHNQGEPAPAPVKGRPVASSDPFAGHDLAIAELRFIAPRLDVNGAFLVDAMTLSHVSQTGAATNDQMRVGSIEFAGMSANMTQVVLYGLTNAGRGDLPAELTEAGDLVIRAFSMDDFHVTGSTPEASNLDFSIAHLGLTYDEIAGVGSVRLDNMELSGVDAETGPVDFTIRSIRLVGVDTDTFSSWGRQVSDFDDQAFLESYFSTVLLRPAEIFRELVIEDIEIAGAGVMIEMDRLRAENVPDGDITRSTAIFDGLSLSADATHPQGATVAIGLQQIGYPTLSLSGEFTTIYDAGTGRAWSEGDNYYQLEDGFRLDMSTDISGYDRLALLMGRSARIADDDVLAQRALGEDILSAIVLHHFAISLTDQGLLDRVVSTMSRNQGLPAEDVRGQLGMMVSSMADELPSGIGRDLRDSLLGFFNAGGTIDIRMEPEGERSLEELLRPDAKSGAPDLRALGLSITHVPAED